MRTSTIPATDPAANTAHSAMRATALPEVRVRRFKCGATGRSASTTPGSSTMSRAVVPASPSRTGSPRRGLSTSLTPSPGHDPTTGPASSKMASPVAAISTSTARDRAVSPS